jgi:hypothetical protein
MANRTIVGFACFLLVLGALAASASAEWSRTHFTFSAPVRLPGVVLPAGTYVFDRPSPLIDPTIVRVTDRHTSKLYLMAFTRTVERRLDRKLDPTVTLGEAPKGTPPTISVWFPQGETRGHQFIYELAGSR